MIYLFLVAWLAVTAGILTAAIVATAIITLIKRSGKRAQVITAERRADARQSGMEAVKAVKERAAADRERSGQPGGGGDGTPKKGSGRPRA